MQVKKYLYVLLLILLNLSCSKEVNNETRVGENIIQIEKIIPKIEIINNTNIPITEIKINTKYVGGLDDIIQFKNKFYIISSNYNSINSSSYSFTQLLKMNVLNRNGDIQEIELNTNRLNEFHLELFERGDSLFLTDKENQVANYLNFENNWIELEKKIENRIYEDESIIVFSEDFGEWGGNTWVLDKKNSIEYEVRDFFTNVSKLGNDYYFSNFGSVFKLTDLKNLKKARVSYNDFLNKNTFNKYDNGIDLSGLEELFLTNDNNFDDEVKRISIRNSFVYKNQLYFLYSLNGIVNIGVLENKKFISKIEFRNLKLRNKFLRNNANKTKSAVFFTEDLNVSGLIEMNDEGIIVYHIINNFQQNIYTSKEMFQWVKEKLDYYLNNLGIISIEDISKLEEDFDAINITTDNGISKAYLEEYIQYDRRKIYRKKEMNEVDLVTEYFYHSDTRKVGAMAFIWEVDKSKNNSQINVSYKYGSVYEYLESKFSKPTEIDETENRSIYIWKVGVNKGIKLETNSKNLSVSIYQF